MWHTQLLSVMLTVFIYIKRTYNKYIVKAEFSYKGCFVAL